MTKEDYRTLLVSMLEHEYLQMTEEKGLIVGLAGERLLKSFKFYAVFKDSEDYTVRAGSTRSEPSRRRPRSATGLLPGASGRWRNWTFSVS